MKTDADGNFIGKLPEYGKDGCYKDVLPPKGFKIVPKGTELVPGDIPYDIYSGWLFENGSYQTSRRYYARPEGRWTTWARKTSHE